MEGDNGEEAIYEDLMTKNFFKLTEPTNPD